MKRVVQILYDEEWTLFKIDLNYYKKLSILFSVHK